MTKELYNTMLEQNILYIKKICKNITNENILKKLLQIINNLELKYQTNSTTSELHLIQSIVAQSEVLADFDNNLEQYREYFEMVLTSWIIRITNDRIEELESTESAENEKV